MENKNKLLFIDSDDSSEKDQDQTKINSQAKTKNLILSGSAKMGQNMMAKNFLNAQHQYQDDYFYEQKPQQIPQPKQELFLRSSKKKSIVDKVIVSRYGVEQQAHKNSETNSSTQKKNSSLEGKQQQGKERQRKNKERVLTFNFSESDDEIPSNQQQSNNQREQFQQNQIFRQNKSESEEQNEIQPIGSQSNNIGKRVLTVADMQSKIDKYEFVLDKIEKQSILEATLIKSKPANNFFYPQFDVFFKGTENHILSGKKQMGNIGSNYPLSINIDNFSHLIDRNYIGKVRTTGKDYIYNIFSEGSNPQNIRGNFVGKKRRTVLATVELYLGKGPRSLDVYTVKEGVKYIQLLKYPHQEPSIKDLFKMQQNRQKINCFKTRKPEWIEQMGQYFLNFKGRINQASVRNFILEDTITKEEVLMFGKLENNIYSINISNPLSPQLALGIILCMFDHDP